MSKIVLYIAASEDYYVARPDGDIQWLHDPKFALEGEDFGYADFFNSIGITLMGRKTYNQVIGFDVPFPYQGKTNYVFTRNVDDQKKDENVVFVSDPIPFVKKLKASATEDIWLIGGAAMNSVFLKENMVDKIILTRVPIALGEGILFCEPLELLENFEMQASRTYDNGFVQLDLVKKK